MLSGHPAQYTLAPAHPYGHQSGQQAIRPIKPLGHSRGPHGCAKITKDMQTRRIVPVSQYSSIFTIKVFFFHCFYLSLYILIPISFPIYIIFQPPLFPLFSIENTQTKHYDGKIRRRTCSSLSASIFPDRTTPAGLLRLDHPLHHRSRKPEFQNRKSN